MARRTIAGAVREAVAGMHWLGDTDQATVALALRYARTLDLSGADDVQAVRMIGPKLLEALRALGGTPAERRALGVDQQVSGRLAELRAARERRGA